MSRPSPVACVLSHLRALVELCPRAAGGGQSAMWPAAVDLQRGGYPADEPVAGKRVYRNIDAPLGCSLYWDQPSITAARTAGRINPASGLAEASTRYLREFLDRCVASNGIFLWGNHYFHRPQVPATFWFKTEEEPKVVDRTTETGWLHEMRPLVPDWEAFWAVDPAATAREIDASSRASLFDEAIGGFNRHADRKREHAFIESGGILVESLAWLCSRQPNPAGLERARRIARFSFGHRGSATGLVRNEPTYGRWDSLVCTSEVGLWAQSLLRAAEYSGEMEFRQMAAEAVRAYLRYGWDEAGRSYYGRLRVEDGSPVLAPSNTRYAPSVHVDFWHPLFPRHDYPWATASACLTLWEQTGDAEFEQGARRWLGLVREALARREGRPIYAEHYGLCLDLLGQARRVLGPASVGDLRAEVAAQAIDQLYVGPMFRGHSGEDRYDAVDGVGYLLNALLRFEREEAA